MSDVLTKKSRNTCKNKLFNHTTSQTYTNKDSYQLKTVTGNSYLYLHCSNNGVHQKNSSDHLGSSQLITNYKGEEYERLEYTPYGELWIERAPAVSIIEIPYRFTGKEQDAETGLYYFGARYLDPRTSRWLGVDPAMGEYVPAAPINDEAKKRNGNLPGMGGVFNYVNFHVYHYAGNNPIKYTDPDGRVPTHYDRVDGSGGGRSVENVRVNIASLAKDHIGSVSWNYNEVKGNLGAGTNKCNLFVYDVAIAAGADLGLPNRGGIRQRVNNIQTPPTAEQWADKNFKIPGWRVLSPNETSMPGDVVAEKINYSDASGHVAIVSGNGKTIGTSSVGVEEIKETTWGFRDNQEGKVVFRRWEGLE